jgi:hypothetical protein
MIKFFKDEKCFYCGAKADRMLGGIDPDPPWVSACLTCRPYHVYPEEPVKIITKENGD